MADLVSLLPFLQQYISGQGTNRVEFVSPNLAAPNHTMPGPGEHYPAPTPLGNHSWLRAFMPKAQGQQIPPLPIGQLPDPTPSFNLGIQPSPIQPTPVPMPAGIDIGVFMKQAEGAFNPVTPMTIPDAPKMKAPVGMDYSPFISQMEQNRPKDPRIPEDEVWGKRLNRGFVGAASRAANADELGEAIMLAAAGFLGGQEGFDTEQRELGLAFDEQNRAFNAQIIAAKMDAEEANVRLANATNEVEYANALADHNTALARAEELQAVARENNAINRQKLEFGLDLAQLGAAQTNQRREAEYTNQENMREHVNSIIAQRSPKMLSMSPDGKFITMQRTNEKGETVLTQEPVGVLGQVEQMAQLAAAIPGIGPELMRQHEYQSISQWAPQMLKRKLIKDILAFPGGERLFDPKDTGGKDWLQAFLYGGDIIRDKLTTTEYEKMLKQVEDHVDTQIEAGLLPEDRAEAVTQELIAMMLEPYLTQDILAKASKFSDPGIQYGIQLLNNGQY